MFGGQGNRVSEAELIGFEEVGVGGAALALVDDGDDGDGGFLPEPAGEVAVGLGEAGAAIDHEEGGGGACERCARLVAHAVGEASGLGFLEPGGVDDGEVEVEQAGAALAAVPRDAGLIVDESEPLADQPVEQRGLADIGAAEDDDARQGLAHVAVLSGRPSACRRR